MRILDTNDIEITSPDLHKGKLVLEKIFVANHPAVKEVAETGHYETVAEYPNGGKDVAWVVDVPGVEAQEAWDEYEDIHRYVPYTEEELAEQNKPTQEDRIAALEAALLEMMGVTVNG